MAFYNCEKLVNSLDRNKQKPELFIVCSRVRGPGKTFSLSHKMMEQYLTTGAKFVLLCRNTLELGNVFVGIFKSMMSIMYPEYSFYEKIAGSGHIFSNCYIEKGEGEEKTTEHVGYVVPLNSADKIKRISSTFSDASCAYFDEFQPETGEYLQKEIEKFLSIHTSLARGNGESRRYFPVYMASNTITVQNPYFVALGLWNKIQPNTKFYKGDGFVFERCENAELAEKHAESAMSRAFKSVTSIDYRDNSWLNDNTSCIEKKGDWGRSSYICTLISGDYILGVHRYPEKGIIYVDFNVDTSIGLTFNILNNDLKPNVPLIRHSLTLKQLKEYINAGSMRFSNLRAKQECLNLLL